MKWKTLKQNGILFPPAFESQGIKIKIKGEKVNLNLLQEGWYSQELELLLSKKFVIKLLLINSTSIKTLPRFLVSTSGVWPGQVTYEAVARDLGYDYVPAQQALDA